MPHEISAVAQRLGKIGAVNQYGPAIGPELRDRIVAALAKRKHLVAADYVRIAHDHGVTRITVMRIARANGIYVRAQK